MFRTASPGLPGGVHALVLASVLGAALAGCSSSPSTGPAGPTAGIPVVASINAWGSILTQLGGTHVRATGIISNPNTDPHSYEPSPSDGRAVATARLMVVNGVGYDSWAGKLLAANPDSGRLVVDVGDLVGVGAGGNPHRWYSPPDVGRVADAITADLKRLAPADAAYFDEQRQAFETQALGEYHALVAGVRAAYAGTPVGASESIFSPMADALGLNLVTPPSFLRAVSEGADPSPADKATIDDQIARKAIKVYVYNSQNSTPDVAAQVKAAKARGIPVVSVTETLSPPKARFQEWQSAQLRSLTEALRQGTGT